MTDRLRTDRLRRRVDLATFTAWGIAVPGLVRPRTSFGDDPGGSPGVVEPVPPPPVAAALAVHADATASIVMGFDAGGGARQSVAGCVAIGHPRRCPGLASSVVQGPEWVEVSLVPLPAAVDEVMRWLPARPHPRSQLTLAVFAQADPAPHWACRQSPVDAGVLAADLRSVLARCLADGLATDAAADGDGSA